MKKLLTTMLATLGCLAAMTSAQAQDAKAGEKKAFQCIGCHGIPGYQASFPEVHKVPMISGQNAKYIAAALAAYKKGERKHPTMRAVAASLTDQDIADLAAFYESHGADAKAADKPSREPSTDVAELLKKGNCAACHGENFSKPIDPSYPKLGGQHPDYLFVALKAYKTDGNPHIGRANAIMAAQAKPFKNDELKAMAQYIGSLEGGLSVEPQPNFR
jgi:cytochrome c553